MSPSPSLTLNVVIMYDTIYFSLPLYGDVWRNTLFDEIEASLDTGSVIVKQCEGTGATLQGRLGNLMVTLSPNILRVENSVCKYYLGNNLESLGREQVREAVEMLSDTLHVPMKQANVWRLDFGRCFAMAHPVNVYLSHLGECGRKSVRLVQPHSVYYQWNAKALLFYDKMEEQKKHKGAIPEDWKGKNVLRYEMRYTRNLGKQLKWGRVTGASLSDPDFYEMLCRRWLEAYKNIPHVNDMKPNFQDMQITGVRDLNTIALLSFIEQQGGELATLAHFEELKKRGEISRRAAFEIRSRIKDVCRRGCKAMKKEDVLSELDEKMKEAVSSLW